MVWCCAVSVPVDSASGTVESPMGALSLHGSISSSLQKPANVGQSFASACLTICDKLALGARFYLIWTSTRNDWGGDRLLLHGELYLTPPSLSKATIPPTNACYWYGETKTRILMSACATRRTGSSRVPIASWKNSTTSSNHSTCGWIEWYESRRIATTLLSIIKRQHTLRIL